MRLMRRFVFGIDYGNGTVGMDFGPQIIALIFYVKCWGCVERTVCDSYADPVMPDGLVWCITG